MALNFEIKLFEDKERGTMAALANDTHISKWCMEAQSIVSDQTVPLHILPLFNPGDTVVDVGAFIGDHTRIYAERIGTSGRVLAFEPYLPSFVCLAVNCRNLPQAELYNCALGNQRGTCWVVRPLNDNAGTVTVNATLDAGGSPITTLDSFNLKSCAFIKIDAEGCEVDILKGAIETIRRCKPVMYVELNDFALGTHLKTKKDVLELMEAEGYTHEFVDPSHTLDMPQVDVILRPK